ncbi:MAG: alpha/beta hydrolase [candidate division KSB1 bacterium]|nr:alpha/beta hydrolase [candidate division KSB1 bacterium]MDZ7356107.1 alpha/beta hydrolase [candidate division KSB1 bacterium]MDZ7377117.1 alpha/beta hydrolase [candidate division KSB1 bacterium]MDZ7398916.1 alpha/beta hydrolase [candidate division KSB1 bacterium]
MEDLSQYCAPGASYQLQWVPVTDNVTLRVVSFAPAKDQGHPPILLVAGWITLISAWKPVLQEMTKDFTVYYIETREKISSRVRGKVEYGVEDIARDIVQLVRHFDFQPNRYILFGSSLGGSAILECCHLLDRDPLCLVLVGPNALFRVPRFGKVIIYFFPPRLYLLIKPVVKWYLKTFRLDVKSDYEQYQKYCSNIDSADPWKLKKAVMKLWHWQAWPLLADIHYPVLIFGASKDSLHEPENLKRMVSMLPTATYIDMETNKATHSKEMVHRMREYLQTI